MASAFVARTYRPEIGGGRVVLFLAFLALLISAPPVLAAGPTISGFSPSSGPVGTSVTITGTNYSATKTSNTVKFNGTAATVSSATTTQLIVAVPSGATSGKITVTVGSSTATSSASFTIPPTITSFSPASGAAGTSVTITGTNFSTSKTSNTVQFGGATATVNSASTTQLKVTVPAAAITGPISVAVASANATSTSSFTVIPALNSVSPTKGPAGTPVTITGTGFSTNTANDVLQFNGINAVVSSATPTQLNAVVPSGLTQTIQPVQATITLSVSGQAATDSITFTATGPPPTITSVGPSGGSPNAMVTITGANFSPTTYLNSVSFNGANANIAWASSSQMIVIVPNAATTGPITLSVYGISTTSPSNFVVVPSQTNTMTYGDDGRLRSATSGPSQ